MTPDKQRIQWLESRLAHMSKLHELAERAMRSAYQAQDQFKELAERYFDEREALLEAVSAAVEEFDRDAHRGLERLRKLLGNARDLYAEAPAPTSVQDVQDKDKL